MMNISAFGTQVSIVASVTFPSGFTVTQFPDDADPADSPEMTVGDTAMGINGDLLVWSKAAPIDVALAVVPRGVDDNNLATLFEANRVAKGKSSAKDVITMTITYPDGMTASMTGGIMVTGTAMPSLSSAGRLKTRPYHFRFENATKANQ